MEFEGLFSAILLLSSWVSLGSSQPISPCMTKLLPCKDYMTPSSSAPPSTCCDPLKAMIKGDQLCLCDIFNNAQLLKSFGVSQDDALKLPKACGESVDIKKCESASDGEDASSLPPDVSKAFEAIKEDSEKRKAEAQAASASNTSLSSSSNASAPAASNTSAGAGSKASAPAASDASGPSASTDSSSDPSASSPTTAISPGADVSTPGANAPSPGSSASPATKSFAQGFGVLAISGVAWMALFN